MEKKSSSLTTETNRLLKEKTKKFSEVFEDMYLKANPDKRPIKHYRKLPEDYDPRKASSSYYRFLWRNRFIKMNMPLPTELQVRTRGRKTCESGDKRIEAVRRCRARKKLEKAGLPIPDDLKRKKDKKVS